MCLLICKNGIVLPNKRPLAGERFTIGRAGLLQLVGMVKAHCCSHQALLCLTAMTMDHVMRLAAMSWNGEGSFLFTSSSAPFDCSDNGPCDEDAASLSVAILKKKLRGRILLGCDNHPVSRQEVMDLVSKSGKFSKKFEGFTGEPEMGSWPII
ncbi:hypothetical protein Dsin_029368 [Dipteronia sinensis]|uniref:Uncharacterized protein n=1 Tax=Dipteronia sinensis TaxID=43782 RepID=A0AAE0DWN3_9ROSI|nr:hypothetical protein Dsin_029368 [Dipteronia sinensis]